MTETCEQYRCEDDAEVSVDLEGDVWQLCEDHAYMKLDGTPVQGYEPNDPEKFAGTASDTNE